LKAHTDDVPLLSTLRTSAVIGALLMRGGYLSSTTDRPRPSFQLRPAKSATFQRIRMSFTVTTYEGVTYCCAKRFNPLRPSYRLFRSRRSHFVPKLRTVLLKSIASVTVRSPAPSVAVRKCKRLFYSVELPCLDLTTQARHRARPAQPSTRTDCLARTVASRSA
jgi:hypothetical protein